MIQEIIGFNVPTLIGLLFVVGAGFQIWAILTYQKEFGYAETLRDIIQGFLDQPGKVEPKKSSELLEDQSIDPESMVGNRVREIEIFSDYAGMVALHDLGAVAAETDAGKLRNAFPGTLIASLLVLGLMGTLWSLRETLSSDELRQFVQKDGSISKVLVTQASDGNTGNANDEAIEKDMNTPAFQKALGNVVSGFGDAFMASICGVLGTILLISIRVAVRANREKCFAEIEKLAIEQLLPYYIEPEQTALKRATDMLDRGAIHYREATRDMQKQSDQLQGSINQLTASTNEANKVFGPEGAVVYQLSEFTKAASRFNSNADNVAAAVDSSTTVMKALIVDCNKLLQSLEQKTQAQSELQIATGKQLEGVIQKLEKTMVQSNAALSKNITKLADSNTGVKESLEQQSKAQLKALNDVTVDLFKRLSETFKSLGEDNESLINRLIKYTNEHNKKNDSVQEDLNKMIKGISSSINGLGDKNKEFVDALVAQSKDSSERRETGLSAFGTQIRELKTTVDSFTQSNTETSGKLLKHLQDSDESSIPKQKELNELIAKLCDKLDNLKLESGDKEEKHWWGKKK